MKKTSLTRIAFAAVAVALISFAQPIRAQGASDVPPVPRDPTMAPTIPGQNINGLRIYIRAGLKTHGPDLHDYPQLLADWSKLLTERGAVVDGSLHAPTAEELARTDVMLMYKGDAGYMTAAEKATMDAFVKRGGGIVTIHDVLCGPDPQYFASIVGGGKKHGEMNYSAGPISYTIVDKSHPIMQGMNETLTIQDEAFYSMTWAQDPQIHVLATAKMPASRSVGIHEGEVVPQIWTYEHTLPGGQPARAFVWMQGHTYTNMAIPELRDMLLRGIAWAGKKPVNELVDYKAPPRPARPPRSNAE